MDFIYEIINTFEFEAILKICLITLLSGIIGLEREAWNKPAGFKTHTLVGLSATLVMICGEYMANIFNLDPSRISAQLLSGIGFIGAGTILRDGFNVKGLTTAASLLAVTCIGLSVGAGFYIGAIFVTALVIVILLHSRNLTDRVEKFNFIKLHIEINEKGKLSTELKEIIENYQITIENLNKIPENENIIEMTAKYKEDIDINKLKLEIGLLEEVKTITEMK